MIEFCVLAYIGILQFLKKSKTSSSSCNFPVNCDTSSILIVPSIWDDPFPLTALEGLATGQAVIASARGGLTEMLKDIGILINDINSKKLVQEMKKLMIDHKKLNDFQKKSWKDFIYQQEEVSKMQDKIRKTIFKNFFIK